MVRSNRNAEVVRSCRVCAAMFAVSPFVIANAPYESTMGLVQKIFYYHMPSAWMFLIGGDRLRRRERALPSPAIRATIARPGGGGAGGAVRPAHAGHRSAVGAEGVGHVVGVGCAPHLEPGRLDDRVAYLILRGTAARVREAGRRPGALRHGQRAVHLHLGELLAHDSPGDDGRADAAVLDGIAAVVLRRRRSCCCFVLLTTHARAARRAARRLDALYLSLDEQA